MSKTFDASRLTFIADGWGYTIFYRGKPIGGAGLAHRDPMHWRCVKKNREDFQEQAQREIIHLAAGRGFPRYREVITKIDAGETDGSL